MHEYEVVIQFWFQEIPESAWWKKDDVLDKEISERFANLLQRASRAELFEWRSSAVGRLAEIIVLDQFSRNIFRGTAKSFSSDPLALGLAQEAVSLGVDVSLEHDQKSFVYMPYMHSESRYIHEQAEKLFTNLGRKESLNFELQHKAIIDRFGRYPHRNDILGRVSTKEEREFLSQPNSSF